MGNVPMKGSRLLIGLMIGIGVMGFWKLQLSPVEAQSSRIEAEGMVRSGPYAGLVQSPFVGVGLYGNGDLVKTNYAFATIPGNYLVRIRGASANGVPAAVAVYAGLVKKNLSFSGTSPTEQSVTMSVISGNQTQEVKLVMETDVGTFDAFVDYVEITYQGPVPPPSPTPAVPSVGAGNSGTYRNLFREFGKSEAQINTKLQTAWSSLFYGTNDGNVGNAANQSVYKAVGSDMAFVEDINNGDIRTEGMSYGMMVAVQMNKRQEFDRLWKFVKTYMLCPRANQCQTGSGLDGYFSWQIRTSPPYDAIDQNPAPDGEEYYATALLFAAGRWGSSGSFNYADDAQKILDAMVNNNRMSGVHSMFNPTKKVIVFSPIGNSANYSDPSYHLPAFYEVWARYDRKPEQRTFWSQAAAASRSYWKTASGHNNGRTNGLMPDCTDLDGNPTNGCAGGAIYAYDAWRTISNVAVDYAWWARDSWEITEVNRLQSFFGAKRPSYGNKWNMDGTSAGGEQNSTGQIAMNAVAGLAGNTGYVWDFVDDVWNLPIPTGRYRYYDGLLYLMALLHLSGEFRVYPGGMSTPGPASPTSIPTPSTSYDLYRDTVVNSLDLGVLLNIYGFGVNDSRFNPEADYDSNEVINGLDVKRWLREY